MFVDKAEMSHTIGMFNVSTYRTTMTGKWNTSIRRHGTEIKVHEETTETAHDALYAHVSAVTIASGLDADYVGKAGLLSLMERRSTETGEFVKIPVYIIRADGSHLYVYPVGGQGRFWVKAEDVDLKEFNHER